jgi:hypothetical protein
MNTTSASATARASEGAGSNVWLFVPSGTIPVIATRSPATFSTMLVIGETVVTTWSLPSSPGVVPHPTSAAIAAMAASRRRSAMQSP